MEDWKQAKVFVTGAAGFVGANLARRLLQEGCEVHVLLRPHSRTWRLADIFSDLYCHEGDLADTKGLSNLLCKIQPSYIWHLATYGAYPLQTDTGKILETNILGTYNLLTACERLGHLRRLVHVGSSSEYGKKTAPMREDMMLEPTTAYGVSKAATTMLCGYYVGEKKIPTTILRPFSIYGPYEERGRLFPDMITALLHEQSPKLADANAVRDFVYIDDVIDALLLAAQASKAVGEVCNIASGKETSISRIFEIAKRVIASSVLPTYGAVASRSYDAERWMGDATKAAAVLGWKPNFSLEDGIEKTVAWFREHLNLYI